MKTKTVTITEEVVDWGNVIGMILFSCLVGLSPIVAMLVAIDSGPQPNFFFLTMAYAGGLLPACLAIGWGIRLLIPSE